MEFSSSDNQLNDVLADEDKRLQKKVQWKEEEKNGKGDNLYQMLENQYNEN